MRLAILFYALGVLLLQCQPALPAAWPWLLASGLGLLLLGRLPGIGRWAILAGALLCGFSSAAGRAEWRLAEALPAAWEGRDIELSGVVAGLPQEFSRGLRFEFDVETALTPGAVVPGRIMLSWYRGRDEDSQVQLPPVLPGERWRFTVRLKRPHGNANPGAFDYEAWLLERGIRATGYVRPQAAERLSAMVWRPDYGIERGRAVVRANFLERLPAEQYPWAGVLVALAVGDQRAINGELWTVFNRTSTSHLMAISGMHVTMVAAVCAWLLAALWRRQPALAGRWPAQRVGLIGGLLAAFGYALLAGFAVPAQRTLIMLGIAVVASLARRNLAPSRVLLLALLGVLLLDPWAVLAAGFWLSFAAVGALLYWSAARIGDGRHWRDKVAQWGMAQWTAMLASLPLVLLLFQQFSLVSPLANALAIPLVSLGVTPLVLLAAIVPWTPLLWLAHLLLEGLMPFLLWCSSWPLWLTPAPPAWAVLLAGLGVAVCLLPRGMPGRALGVFLLLPVILWPVARPAPAEAWVTVLDVGQGLAVVVRTREHVLIYDPGPLYSAESDAGQRVVVPYLRWLGLQHVDRMIVTHRDTDHAGGAASVLAALPVGEVLSSVPEIPGEPCEAGKQWQWEGVEFDILHPPPGGATVDGARAGKSNHQSCVLRVVAGGQRLLLTSDIEAPDEASLLRQPADVAADVLLVPHHGSRTSSTPAFLAAVGARDAIVAAGYRNRFGHPKADVLERYAQRDIRLWRTDRDGAVQIRLNAAGIGITAWRQEARRYWHGR